MSKRDKKSNIVYQKCCKVLKNDQYLLKIAKLFSPFDPEKS